MQNIEWKKVSEREERVGYRMVYHKTFTMPDGKNTDWTVVEKAQYASVLAVTPDLQIICAKQYRPGVEAIISDLPGGVVDLGENPLTAAKRELLEETGYAGELTHLASSPLGAWFGVYEHHFLATDCKKIAEPEFGEDEFIEIEMISIEQMIENIHKGLTTDVGTVLLGLMTLAQRGLISVDTIDLRKHQLTRV